MICPITPATKGLMVFSSPPVADAKELADGYTIWILYSIVPSGLFTLFTFTFPCPEPGNLICGPCPDTDPDAEPGIESDLESDLEPGIESGVESGVELCPGLSPGKDFGGEGRTGSIVSGMTIVASVTSKLVGAGFC